MKKVLFWVLVILWMGVIFVFSSYNGEDSTKQSKDFLRHTIGNIILVFDKDISIEKKEEIIDIVDPIIRKLAHASVYFILGILVCLALNNHDINVKKILVYSVVTCFLYACSDEIHQLFVDGRSGEVLDVLLDTLGSFLGICIFYKIYKKQEKIFTKSCT